MSGFRPIDLTAFLQAMELAPTLDATLSEATLAFVEAAWALDHGAVSSYGFVVVLREGRRLYLEYTLDDTGNGALEALSTTSMSAGEVFPTLDNEAGVYWYQPQHINQHLGLPPRRILN